MKKYHQKTILINYTIMGLLSYGILMLTTGNELFLDLQNYRLTDGVCLFIFVLVGFFVGRQSQKKSFVYLLFLFYYLLFACFNDGHGAGWTHTKDITEKFMIMIVVLIILSISIITPGILFLIAFLQNIIVKIIDSHINR